MKNLMEELLFLKKNIYKEKKKSKTIKKNKIKLLYINLFYITFKKIPFFIHKKDTVFILQF